MLFVLASVLTIQSGGCSHLDKSHTELESETKRPHEANRMLDYQNQKLQLRIGRKKERKRPSDFILELYRSTFIVQYIKNISHMIPAFRAVRPAKVGDGLSSKFVNFFFAQVF